jgi:hypothetical protein
LPKTFLNFSNVSTNLNNTHLFNSNLNQIKQNETTNNSNITNSINEIENTIECVSECLDQLFDYYQTVYEPTNDNHHTIAAFKSKLLSGPLRRIAEIEIDEELQPNCNSFWNTCYETFVIPEVYINHQRVYALVDTGASSSVMSLKFSQTETIESLKLIFKSNTRIMRMANGNEVKTHGQLENVPINVDNVQTTANTQILHDLSYDLILGREWCEANGVVLDFSKKKMYFLKPQEEEPCQDFVCQFDEKPIPYVMDPNKFAQLKTDILLDPYHETKVIVQSKQNNLNNLFVKNHDSLVDRFGVFVFKGIVRFNDNLATIVLANLTNETVSLPAGLIVANLELFEENDWNIIVNDDTNESENNGIDQTRAKQSKNNLYIISTNENMSKYRTWQPMSKRVQNLIINGRRKLVAVVDTVATANLADQNSIDLIDNEKENDLIDKENENDLIDKENENDLIEKENGNKFIHQENIKEKPKETLENNLDKNLEPYETVKIDENNLSQAQLTIVKDLIASKAEIFAKKNEAPSKALNVSHSIETGNSKPIHSAKYRSSHKERPIIEEHVKEMLRTKVIEPSRSPWSSPVVLVPKKDGSIRFCVDYRRLNDVTIKDKYALPRIDDALASLSGNKYFTSLDLSQGYLQIPMDAKDKEKTAFITDSGLYQFNVMSFGLTNAPATFQRYMDAVFSGLKWNCLLVYIDDILIFSPTFEAHIKDVETVFNRLAEANLQLKPTKCHFFQKELVYLGHLVTANGLRPDPLKVKAILEMETPEDATDVRSFIGMTGFYRSYIDNFAKTCEPLYNLTRIETKFKWKEQEKCAFESLKKSLANAPILCHPNFNFPFIIETDASLKGLGAVLVQRYAGKTHVIQYISRTLQPAERKWHIRELEALAILWACEMFRVYVSQTKFIVESDHESLQ